jgi:hypothetical protein
MRPANGFFPFPGKELIPMSQNSAANSNAYSDAFFTETLADRDPEIFSAIQKELGRQRHEIELIASENIVSRAVWKPRARS